MSHTPDIYDNSLYKTVYDIAIIGYIVNKRDMAGVVPIMTARLASAVRTTSKKALASLRQLSKSGEIVMSGDQSHIWWERGIYYTLYRGRYSDKQMASVVKTLNQWDSSGVFGGGFAERVADIYRLKYNITLPFSGGGKKEERVSSPEGYSLDLEALKESIV